MYRSLVLIVFLLAFIHQAWAEESQRTDTKSSTHDSHQTTLETATSSPKNPTGDALTDGVLRLKEILHYQFDPTSMVGIMGNRGLNFGFKISF